MKLESLAVHAGDRKKPGDYVPVTTPIFTASSFFYPDMQTLDRVFGNEIPGQNYTRYNNPTTNALEEQVAALEDGEWALASSSGMAALHLAVLVAMADRRRSVVAGKILYGAIAHRHGPWWWSIRLSPRRCCCARSGWEPTSWSTASPSIWPDTATSWAVC